MRAYTRSQGTRRRPRRSQKTRKMALVTAAAPATLGKAEPLVTAASPAFISVLATSAPEFISVYAACAMNFTAS